MEVAPLKHCTVQAFSPPLCPRESLKKEEPGLGEVMLNWIAGICSNLTARVKANGVLSDSFLITNGMRQGCTLSLLLFALSLEPFLSTIRLNPDIQGVTVGQTQLKFSSYADDLMFSLTNPVVSLPNLLKEFEIYGK